MSINVAVGLGIPFLGTALGAACVFLLQGEMNATVRKTMLGFAAGVMVAASVWSLLIPAMDLSEGMGKLAFIPAAAGFLLGILFLLVLDRVVPHLHLDSEEQEGVKSNWKKSTMLILAVTLHNIPEGASVGIVLAGAMAGGSPITMAGALALSVGIAIQNFPEGAIISLPLKEELGKGKAFLMGTMSGAVEPVAAVVTLLLAEQMTPFIPYTLAFAAGAMLYVVVEELIPESAEGAHSNMGTLGFAAGFVIMMILDVALG
jgi:ZIP family zinc transporter